MSKYEEYSASEVKGMWATRPIGMTILFCSLASAAVSFVLGADVLAVAFVVVALIELFLGR